MAASISSSAIYPVPDPGPLTCPLWTEFLHLETRTDNSSFPTRGCQDRDREVVQDPVSAQGRLECPLQGFQTSVPVPHGARCFCDVAAVPCHAKCLSASPKPAAVSPNPSCDRQTGFQIPLCLPREAEHGLPAPGLRAAGPRDILGAQGLWGKPQLCSRPAVRAHTRYTSTCYTGSPSPGL